MYVISVEAGELGIEEICLVTRKRSVLEKWIGEVISTCLLAAIDLSEYHQHLENFSPDIPHFTLT